MEKIIQFFLIKSRLNYTLFTFLVILGLISYITIPKDLFPAIKIDKVIVSGSYSGASIDTLNKMAVIKLEKNLKAINGVKKLESFIKNGEFTIILTLEKGSDKISILNKSKDIISNNRSDLPSDMDEPVASLIDLSFPLINITIASNIYTKDELISVADNIKTDISSIPNIAKVQLYESTTKTFEIILDTKKLEALQIEKELLFSEIRKLSYIYPMGKIEDKKEHLYLSTINGKKKTIDYLNTLIKVGDKVIYLGDIANIEQKYDEVDIISHLNGAKNITLGVFKNEKANSIELAKLIKQKIQKINSEYKDIDIRTFYDTSVYIKSRLNTVVSGIMFGLILVAIALYILINKRIAFVVVLGIPTAILLGVFFLFLGAYTINLITLIGTLLIIGVLVDDAVIIAENIQRHISQNKDKLQATIDGTKEVLVPVLASSLTTIFAFLPMLMLSGEMGEFLKMIPIAVMILIATSLLESFVFLPIHSLHVLDKNDKELDWSKAQNLYSKILHKILDHRKKFLLIFIVLIPAITIIIISSMRYQFFPDFDTDRMFINGKFDINTKVEQTYEQTKIIEDILLKHKDELALKTIAYTSGMRMDNDDNLELKQSVFSFNIELHSRVPTNFVDEYITPILSFSGDDSLKIRTLSVDETLLKLKELLKDHKPKNLKEFVIKKEGAGINAYDIEVQVNAKDKNLLLDSVKIIKNELDKLDGIIFVDDTAKFGVRQLKLKLNSYGESLGLNESSLASLLTPLFLKGEQAKGLGDDGVFKILTYDIKKDSFNSLKNLEINIPNTEQKIALYEVCDFTYVDNFDSISKVNRVEVKKVIANVNNKVITAIEALEKLEPSFEKLRQKGVTISFGGEQEQNERMKKELSFAFFIAIFLIFIVLLIIFDSFKLTFMILSIIPFSILGALIGHLILSQNLSLSSAIGIMGLAGVVINDAIVMLDFIKRANTLEEMIDKAKLRLRPIIITSITTFLGLSTLIFFAIGQAKILQPIAISLGFGLIWGTVLTLIYLPALYAVVNKMKKQ